MLKFEYVPFTLLELEPLSFKQWKELNFPLFDEHIAECEWRHGKEASDGYRTALQLEYDAYLKVQAGLGE